MKRAGKGAKKSIMKLTAAQLKQFDEQGICRGGSRTAVSRRSFPSPTMRSLPMRAHKVAAE